jgi:4-alpha-glucanotransferase
MRVLEFGFDVRDDSAKSEHLPHNYPRRCVAYLGTHDNETALTWLRGLGEHERALLLEYLAIGETEPSAVRSALISVLLRSSAERCIVTVQDWLGLDDRARINTPSSVGENWRWRLGKEELTEALGARILRMTSLYGRRNQEKERENEKLCIYRKG